jgi:hypothetical protein
MRDKAKWRNVRKYTPIPGLANHIAWFNRKRTKLELATMRAELADKFFHISMR